MMCLSKKCQEILN